MKIATAAYDKNGVLAIPPKVYQGRIDDALVLTTDGGYWHTVTKLYYTELARDLAMATSMETITSLNGTVTYEEAYEGHIPSEDRQGYLFKLVYVIEEPDHVPFTRFAASIDKLGIDPDFVYPYDGVAEQGPTYRTPYQEQLATIAAFTGNQDGVRPIPSALSQSRTPRGLGTTAVRQHVPEPAPQLTY